MGQKKLSEIKSPTVSRAVANTVQLKLKVGKPGDIYEKEADNVADSVMRMPEPFLTRQPEEEEEIQPKLFQRQEEEEEPVQTKQIQRQPEGEEEVQTMLIQKQNCTECANTEEPRVQTSPESHVASCSGQALSSSTKNYFEPRFGKKFNDIKVHTCNTAVQMNRDLNAQAFTYGNNIFFNKGKYNPEASDGKKLLAHELTHTIQQKGGSLDSIQREQSAGCVDSVPYRGTFSNLLRVAFYSTEDCPNIRVIIYHRAHVDAYQSCASFDVSIDGVSRTRRTVQTSDTESRTVLTFRMQNAVRHHLIFYMPTDCRGLRISVRGSIRRS